MCVFPHRGSHGHYARRGMASTQAARLSPPVAATAFSAALVCVMALLWAAPAWAAARSGVPTADDWSGAYATGAGNNAGNGGLTIGTGGDATSVAGAAYGGYSADGDATDNTVTVTSGGAVSSDIYGGYSRQGSATGNAVTVTNGGAVMRGGVFGGCVNTGAGSASNNSLTITGGDFATLAGVSRPIQGGRSESGPATGNTVTITGGSFLGPIGGLSLSGGVASGNTVTFSGATTNSLMGGLSHQSAATGNSVNVSSGRVNGDIMGGRAETDATGNTVTVTGGSVGGNVFGGRSDSDSATGNTVIIGGAASVRGNVFGGSARWGGSTSTATDNTIRIKDAPTFDARVILWGGVSPGDARSGNTLELHTTNITVFSLLNFQHFRFHLPSTIAANDTVLTVTRDAALDISTPAGRPATTVGVGIMGGGRPSLKLHDVVNLIRTSRSTLRTDAALPNTLTGMQGISTVYEFELQTDATTLMARVTKAASTGGGSGGGSGGGGSPQPLVDDPVNPGGGGSGGGGSGGGYEGIRKSPAEGRAAGVAAVSQGGELLGGQGMTRAWLAAREADTAHPGRAWAWFGAASGGMSTYATGSHVDVQGSALMTGLVKRFPLDGADLVAGPFFEAGMAAYKSYNDGPRGANSVRAKGDSNYQGGGLLARLESAQGLFKGLYVEGSARGGSLRTTYRSDDLNPALSRASYATTAAYMGAHGGVGYLWRLNEKIDLDLYAKYFWTRVEAGSATVLGDNVRFAASDSHRVRAGARVGRDLTPTVRPYVGAAWDHEFAGDARSAINGEGVAAPSLAGSTGVGELGLEWKPAPGSNFSVDLAAQGYVGMREGWGGTLQLKYEF